MKFLIVEDELPLVQLLRSNLLSGFPDAEIQVAHTVEAARKIVDESQQIDLSVIDLRLPNNGVTDIDSGYRVIDHLLKKFKNANIIVNTARSDDYVHDYAEKKHLKLLIKTGRKHNLIAAACELLEKQD